MAVRRHLRGRVSQLVVGVVLARLLTPADFGITALGFVGLGLVQAMADFGLGSAIVRGAELTDRHVRSAFTASVLGGLFAAAVIVAAAPLAAAAMHDLRVTPVLRALSLVIVLRGTSVIADSLLRRHLDFRRAFFIDIVSYLVGYGAVAVSLAVHGYGVWSLVLGSLMQTAIASCAQLAAVRHPMRPLLARRESSELLAFGFPAATSRCVNYLALNGDYFVVGRLMGAVNLGLYTRAYGLMNLPQTYAAAVMSSVMFPAIAHVQREPARVRSGFLTATRLTAMVAASSMATLAVIAPHLIWILYGPQWTGAVMPLQILCAAGYFRALYHLGGIVARAVGRVYRRALASARVRQPGDRRHRDRFALRISRRCHRRDRGHSVHVRRDGSSRVERHEDIVAIVCARPVRSGGHRVRHLLARAHREMAVRTISHVSSPVIVIGVLAAAAVPWTVGMLWTLRHAELNTVRASLPRFIRQPLEVLSQQARWAVGSDELPL